MENNMDTLFDVNLKDYNTFKIESFAKKMVFPKSIEEVITVIEEINKSSSKFMILGLGSNLIFKTKYFDGTIINLKNLNQVEFNKQELTAGAGVNLIKLSTLAANKGLSGLEFAYGIPGTVGGAVYMNAGAYKSSVSEILVSAKVLDSNLNLITYSNEDFDFDYRHSILSKNSGICLEATFKLFDKDIDDIKSVMQDRKKRRVEDQPLEFPSAGSVFRNPPNNLPSGKLIEDEGLKGFSVGGAMISQKHANFIINNGNASGDDVVTLINEVIAKVQKKHGIKLKPEPKIIE